MPTPLDRLVFFGTPDFAVPTLAALVAAGRTPLLVATQPDRRAGRGRKLRRPPVAEWAEAARVPVVQVETVRDPVFLDRLRDLEPDLGVVVAFGQIFPPVLLELPRCGCVNVHASLLPRHRGAAPIQSAILAGDDVTGVTTMRMDEGLDTGPILLQSESRLGGFETAGRLTARLAHLGAALLLETLDGLETGAVAPQHQEGEGATYAPRITKEDGRIDWSREAAEVFAQLRAMTPWPGAWTSWRKERLRIVDGRPLPGSTERSAGAVIGPQGEDLAVACGRGSVFGVRHLQRAGRAIVAAEEFVRGARLGPDSRLE